MFTDQIEKATNPDHSVGKLIEQDYSGLEMPQPFGIMVAGFIYRDIPEAMARLHHGKTSRESWRSPAWQLIRTVNERAIVCRLYCLVCAYLGDSP